MILFCDIVKKFILVKFSDFLRPLNFINCSEYFLKLFRQDESYSCNVLVLDERPHTFNKGPMIFYIAY